MLLDILNNYVQDGRIAIYKLTNGERKFVKPYNRYVKFDTDGVIIVPGEPPEEMLIVILFNGNSKYVYRCQKRDLHLQRVVSTLYIHICITYTTKSFSGRFYAFWISSQ